MVVSLPILSEKCESYSEVFSKKTMEKSIREFPFPCVKRKPATDCKRSAWLQKGSESSFINSGEDATVFENKGHLSPNQVTLYSTPEGIVDLNKKGISLAVEKRVALFFQQAILCFGMSDFTFAARGADDQIGTSPSIKLSSIGGPSIVHHREAAHSSTIPTLIAYANDGSTPSGFVYLKGGSYYFDHNATIGMHECVNGADELIDGKGNDNKLRETTVKILNRIAQGLEPVQATYEFIAAFDSEVENTAKILKNKETPSHADPRRLVLERYHLKIGKIKAVSQNPKFFDGLIGIIIQPDPRELTLRQVLFKKRYDMILFQEVIKSRIGKRIDEAKNKMGVRDRSLLEFVLLKEFSEKSERKILEKLFCKTAVVFESEYGVIPSQLKSFRTRVENIQLKYQSILAPLMRDLRSDFRESSCAEFSFRAGVFKDLRTKVNNWTQNQFCENYFKTTEYKVSQTWVSRMEQLSRLGKKTSKAPYKTPINQRRRYISLDEAMRCAKTFKVDPGIFFPSIFTSQQ